MKISNKKKRAEYCKHYFETIKPKALSSEIASHIINNKDANKNMLINSKVIGRTLKDNPKIFQCEPHKNGLLIWELTNEAKIIIHEYRKTDIEELNATS